ncbi:hypothetical protein M0804_004506 [Polistes exclamans]|nr:hypothetical protein M0804_004506 [Polistes exclamans]
MGGWDFGRMGILMGLGLEVVYINNREQRPTELIIVLLGRRVLGVGWVTSYVESLKSENTLAALVINGTPFRGGTLL